MSLIALSRLLIEGRSDTHPVAWRNGQLIDFRRFHTDVMRACGQFKNCHSAALLCQDSYNFAVGLFGLLYANAKIILPSNSQPETLRNLKVEFDLVVNDDTIATDNHESEILKPIDPTNLSLYFFSSGSTGTPKKIPKNLEMLENEIATLNGLWSEASDEKGTIFATVSHQHIYGLTFKLLWPLAVGRAFSAEMHLVWESLMAALTPGAVIVSSPAHLGRLEGITPLASNIMPNRIFSAGAPLSFEAGRQTKEIFGCSPTEIFGSTETGAIATRMQTSGNESWHLLPGISMRIDDSGRLVLQSPFVGPDWLTTDDLIEPLDDGFRFLGRADRIVKIEGKRTSLIEIERALTELAEVKEAAVIILPGKPDRLVAAVVPSETGRLTLGEIGGFRFGALLRSKLASIQEAAGTPRSWRFVDKLPTQALGKQRDADIRTLFEGSK